MTERPKLVSKILIEGRIEDVWHEIIKTDEPQQAMFGARMHRIGLSPGSPIRMLTPDNKYTSVVGEILEVKSTLTANRPSVSECSTACLR
jgi:hypothetical protein